MTMLDFVFAWIDRQFGNRLSVDEQMALCARMMRRYRVDPELYDNVSLWRLNDDATVAGEG